MAQPHLLLRLSDSHIENQLFDLPILNQFSLHRVEQDESWVHTMTLKEIDVAIVQATHFNEEDLINLIEHQLPRRKDIIFITNGEPNPFIDRAMQQGASYHLRLPVDIGYVEELLQEIYSELTRREECVERAFSSNLDQFGLLVGSSPIMRKLYRVIRKAAGSKVNVFLVGESGAGKELVATTLHLMSTHSDKPFVAVNCGALSPELIESELFGHVKGAFTGAARDRSGVFEQAEGGTLFLDEITEMPMDQQVKLLRVLESCEYRPVGSDKVKKTNVQVISATNRDPLEAIREEVLREDLYFRLAHFPIHVPPLRDRGDDVTELAKHFLAYRNAQEQMAKKMSPEALQKISDYSWPGNVRELKHAIERAYILADNIILASHLILDNHCKVKSINATTFPSGLPLDEIEKRVILKTLAKNDGNKSVTANQLGVSVKTLYNKLEKYEK